jgi:hypothetical protein
MATEEVVLDEGWLTRDVADAAFTVASEKWQAADRKCRETYIAWRQACEEYRAATDEKKQALDRLCDTLLSDRD